MVLFGVAVRLRQFFFNRSLWNDEALLALNLASRSFAGLTRPLDYDQGAPLLFLWAQKLAVTLFGSGEMAMRVVPCACAIATLLLVRALTVRHLQPLVGLLALGLVVCGERLLFYAAEAKQYGADVTVATALLLLSANAWRSRTRGNFIALGIGAALGVWASHPAVFVIAGGVGTLGMLAWRTQDRRLLRAAAIIASTAAASFLIEYVWLIRPLQANSYLRDFWAGGMLPQNAHFLDSLAWVGRRVVEAFVDPARFSAVDSRLAGPRPAITTLLIGALAAALFVIGCVRLWREQPLLGRAIASVVVLTLLASLVRRYPFLVRMLLFAVPMLYIGVAAGLAWLLTAPRHGAARLAGAMLALAILYYPLGVTLKRAVHPFEFEEIRPAVETAARNCRPGDVLYVFYRAREAFAYYRARYPSLNECTIVDGARPRQPGAEPSYDQDVARLRGRRRVWVVFSRVFPDGLHPNQDRPLLDLLDVSGHRLQGRRAPGAAVFLYDLSSPPQDTQAQTAAGRE